MLRCHKCDSNRLRRIQHEVKAKIGGVSFRIVEPATECAACGEVTVAGEVVRRAELSIAARLAEMGVTHGEAVRAMRGAVGLRSAELAEILGVAAETMSRWETGKSHIDPCAFGVLGGLVEDRLAGRTDTTDRMRSLREPRPRPKQVKIEIEAA